MIEELAASMHLSHYRTISKLGAGGMGEVYLAQDTKLDRQVALKILPPEFAADKDRMSRFVREAKSASALNHPNIITIHEIGETDGTHFIATEYIQGETLHTHLTRYPLDLRTALDIAIQVASALDAAHRAGIVHRDIKPENVMLRPDGLIKLLDFGIAKLSEQPTAAPGLEVDEEAATALKPPSTSPGMVIGTANYMSPEQARGKDVDARTDIFSFGIVFYEMLTGRRAFAGENALDVIGAILHKEPMPLKQILPDIPADVERIVRKTLRKDREERYQTARGLLTDLKDAKQELEFQDKLHRTSAANLEVAKTQVPTAPTTDERAAPTSSAEFITGEIRKHKFGVALASLILLSLVGVGVWFFFFRSSSSSAPIDSIAVLPFQNRSVDADTEYLSDGLAESLIYRLSQLPNLKVSPTSSVFHYKGRETDPVKVGRELGVSAVLSGRIVQRGDNLTTSVELVDVRYNKLLWGEQYERKMSELLSTQREIAREIVDRLRLKVTGNEQALAKHYTESNDAYQLYLKGRFYYNKRTEEGMLKSLDYFRQAIERDPTFALADSGLADSYCLLGTQDSVGAMSPDEAMPKAKAASLKALESDDTLAEPHVSLAHVKYYYDHDWAGAEREYKRAIELNPNYAQAHSWYAIYLMSAGRFDEALAEVRRAQELDPLSLPINMTVGWVLGTAGRFDESVEQLRKTLEMDPNFILAHHRLGMFYEQQGRYDEAIGEFKQVINLSGGKPQGIAALARTCALAGKREEAQRQLADLQELSKQRYVSPVSIAIIHAALGDNDRAFAWLDKADKGHDLMLARLEVDRRFDSLRSDPRFRELVRRVSFPS